MKILLSYFSSLLIFTTFSLWAQKQVIGSFEELDNKQVDVSGTVVAFSTFVDGQDTFYVKDLRNHQIYSFEDIAHQTHLNDRFAILESRRHKICYILNLIEQKIDTLYNIELITFIPESNELVFRNLTQKSIVLKKLDSGTDRIFKDILLYNYRHCDNKLFFLNSQMKAGVFSVNTGKKTMTNSLSDIREGTYKKILFPDTGLDWYLIGTDKKKLKILKIGINKVSEIFEQNLYDSSDNTIIDTLFHRVRLLGNDRIAFGLKPYANTKSEMALDAEIWYGFMKEQVPMREYLKQAPAQLVIADLRNKSWHSYYQKNKWIDFKIDEQDQLYYYEVFGNNDQTKLFPDISVYKLDNITKSKMFVGRFNGNNRSVFSFKDFPFLIYFYNNNWYYFDDIHHISHHINLGSDGKFYDDQKEFYQFTTDASIGIPIPYDKKQILFNDTHDMWIYNTVSGELRRDTEGREEGRRYRFDKCNYTLISKDWSWYPINKISNKQSLILKWTSNMHTIQGISLYQVGKGTRTLVEDKAEYSNILINGNFITYIKQKASKPPTLYLFDIEKNQEYEIYQSNSWDYDVEQVNSQYFSWKNKEGMLRGAIVRFPKNYSSAQKYPVIVNIYEKKYPVQHRYVSPFSINATTVNFREYTDAGYLVIEPDIFYEVGNPGVSAFTCVTEVLDELASRFSLNQERIGLIGHSFGGYQTNFIITQTNRFKAAVSSAGVSDLVNRYFVYSKEAHRPEMWRAESQQARMAKSFFEIPEKYIANSPIYHAKNINTPLLLISGKDDYTVNWEQSMYMFNALKRLKKDVNLILYSGEKHEILKPINRLDVSMKIRFYFDYHLKDEELPDWIKEGLH